MFHHYLLGPLSNRWSHKPSKHCHCRVFDLDLFSLFICISKVKDGFSDLHFDSHHDKHHLYSLALEETLAVKHLEHAFNHTSLSHEYHPLPKSLPVRVFFCFLFQHALLHLLQDLPFVQLENPVLLEKFFFFILVDSCDFTKDLSPMFTHFLLDLFFVFVKSDCFQMLLFRVFLRPLFFQV